MTARAGGRPQAEPRTAVGTLALDTMHRLSNRPDLTTGMPLVDDAALADLRALMADRDAWREAAGVRSMAECEAIERAMTAEAERDRLRAALDAVNALAWHSESEGKPDLPCVDRWRIVEICRAALAECGSSSVASRPAGELGGGK